MLEKNISLSNLDEFGQLFDSEEKQWEQFEWLANKGVGPEQQAEKAQAASAKSDPDDGERVSLPLTSVGNGYRMRRVPAKLTDDKWQRLAATHRERNVLCSAKHNLFQKRWENPALRFKQFFGQKSFVLFEKNHNKRWEGKAG